MSKICMATAQLVSEKRMDDEIVSGVKKKSKEQKGIRQVMQRRSNSGKNKEGGQRKCFEQ